MNSFYTFFIFFWKLNLFYIFLLIHMYFNTLVLIYGSFYGFNFIKKNWTWHFFDLMIFFIFYLMYFW